MPRLPRLLNLVAAHPGCRRVEGQHDLAVVGPGALVAGPAILQPGAAVRRLSEKVARVLVLPAVPGSQLAVEAAARHDDAGDD